MEGGGLFGEYIEAGLTTDLLLAIDGVAFGRDSPPLLVPIPEGVGDNGEDIGAAIGLRVALELVAGVDSRLLLVVDNLDDIDGMALNDVRLESFVVLRELPRVDIVMVGGYGGGQRALSLNVS